jgi:hypothetical protein
VAHNSNFVVTKFGRRPRLVVLPTGKTSLRLPLHEKTPSSGSFFCSVDSRFNLWNSFALECGNLMRILMEDKNMLTGKDFALIG